MASGGKLTVIGPTDRTKRGTGSSGVAGLPSFVEGLLPTVALTAISFVVEFPAGLRAAAGFAPPPGRIPELPTSRRVTDTFDCSTAYSAPPKPEEDEFCATTRLGSGLRSLMINPSPMVVWSGSCMTTCDVLVMVRLASSYSR